MNQQTMMRLAMVLQNQAPSTLDKYICKLAENTLIEHKNGLTLMGLANEINAKFSLSFTTLELKKALMKKRNTGISFNQDTFYLEDKARNALLRQEAISDVLHKYVVDFLKQNSSIKLEPARIEEILINYLYFCFNSNVENLLLLFNKKDKQGLSFSENVSSEEIEIVNLFISWGNEAKDQFIYSIVATCYEYCMLTVKNDSVISKELFRGKKFYLDSNIIFRMAGINKDEKRFIANNFVKQCKAIGIEVCCTSVTFDEIYRVINSQINYIKSKFSTAPPVKPEVLLRINPSYESNDFYNLYYDWCQIKGNHYRDINSFYEHLLDLVRDALEKLEVKNIRKEKYINAKDFSDLSDSLREYKNNNNHRHIVSKNSSDTDIINIKEIQHKRTVNQESIWQTNEFMVSADQLLITWSTEMLTGVPIVVLPSVWLSIILRFTGRTNDDYRSFCLFLNQRQSRDFENLIDPLLLIGKINNKTSDTKIRDRLIEEVIKHKNDFDFSEESDYDSCVDQAVDRVIEEVKETEESKRNELKALQTQQLQQLKKTSQEELERQSKKHSDDILVKERTEREKTILYFAKNKARNKVKFFRFIDKHDWIFYIIAAVLFFGGILLFLFRRHPIIMSFFSSFNTAYSETQISFFFTGIQIALSLLGAGLIRMCNKLGSAEREQRLIKKYEREYMSKIEKGE